MNSKITSYSASASQSAIAAPYRPFNLLLKYEDTEDKQNNY